MMDPKLEDPEMLDKANTKKIKISEALVDGDEEDYSKKPGVAVSKKSKKKKKKGSRSKSNNMFSSENN